MRILVASAGCLGGLVLAGCPQDDPEIILDPGTTPPITTFETELTVTDLAVEAHLQDWRVGNHFKHGRACMIGDIDLDGRQDLIVTNPGDESYWLQNLSEPGSPFFEARDVFSDIGLLWSGTLADFDDDGDLDFAAPFGGLEGRGRDSLYRNDLQNGVVSWTDIAEDLDTWGIYAPFFDTNLPSASLTATWLDVDNDADLDFFVDSHVYPHQAADGPTDNTPIGRNLLWRNDGGVFTDIAEQSGLTRRATTQFTVWFDFDNDGDLDMFEPVYMWGGGLNTFWVNEGGTFVDRTDEMALDGGDLRYPIDTFSTSMADFNNDGWMDMLLFVRGVPEEGPYTDGHMLMLNVQGRGFVNASEVARLNNPFDPGFRDHLVNGVMGATTEDLNLDGIPDVFIGNGGPGTGWENGLYLSTGTLLVEDYLGLGPLVVPQYDNASDLINFPAEEEPGAPFYPPYPYRTHAACAADLDEDGHRELYVTNGGMNEIFGQDSEEPNRLFTFFQDPAPRWIKVTVHGDGVNVHRNAIGSRITVVAENADGTLRTVTDHVSSRNGFGAQHGFVRQIGLGSAERIVSITVTAPDRTEHVYDGDAELDTSIDIHLD